jgi:hypothetical protein
MKFKLSILFLSTFVFSQNPTQNQNEAILFKSFLDHVKDKLNEYQKNLLEEYITALKDGKDTKELKNKLQSEIPEDLAKSFFLSEGEINIQF